MDAFWSRITSEIALIRGGEGGDLLSGVEAWVRAMQFCALQDMAKEYPDHFDDCWIIVQCASWKTHGDNWLTALRQQEDHDIGWLWSLETPTWSSGVASLQDKLKKMALEIQRSIKDDDGNHWFHHVGSETQRRQLSPIRTILLVC